MNATKAWRCTVNGRQRCDDTVRMRCKIIGRACDESGSFSSNCAIVALRRGASIGTSINDAHIGMTFVRALAAETIPGISAAAAVRST